MTFDFSEHEPRKSNIPCLSAKIQRKMIYIGGNIHLLRDTMEEPLCYIEISRDNRVYIIKVHASDKGVREYKGYNFEDLLTELVMDLQEEYPES
jgi:hypothetical protein